MNLSELSCPVGAFYDFLNRNGGGPSLAKTAQVCQAISGGLGFLNYCLISIMGMETGFKAFNLNNGRAFLPLKLERTGDQYTPINIFPY